MEWPLPIEWEFLSFVEVRAYYYNPSGESGVPILSDDGPLHPSVTNPEGALLSRGQAGRLARAFFTPDGPGWAALCGYTPRHAFVFRDEALRVVAVIELCFQCMLYRISPKADFQRIRPDWDALRELVRELSLPVAG